MSAAEDRREGDRRSTGRRQADQIAAERRHRSLQLADPVRMALWELQMEAVRDQDRERLARLRELAAGFKYGERR